MYRGDQIIEIKELCAPKTVCSNLKIAQSARDIFIVPTLHTSLNLGLFIHNIFIMDVGIEFLPCPLCSIPYFKDVHALRSTLIKVATTQLSCPVCNEHVMGLDKLTIHLFSHMNDNTNTSKRLLEDIQDKQPVDNITNSPFSSVDSEKVVDKLEDLPIISKEDLIVCDICNFTFSDRTILELHQKLLHQTNPDKTTGAYNFHCHLCSKTFKMRGSLIVHLRVAHYGFSNDNVKLKIPKTISQGEESFENENISLPKSIDNKQWECEICSKMFTTKYFLKKHKRLHTGEMPYTCNLCNKSFTFQQSYHKHMLYHSSEKPHTCNECGRSFKELSTLQNHARIHSGERPFACETCGKRFRQRVSYLVHRRIHTGAMPYDCKICGKKFRYKVSQRSHKCEAQSDSNDKESSETNTRFFNDDGIQENNVQCILSVDYDGKISFITKNDDLNKKNDVNQAHKEGKEASSLHVNCESSNNKEDIDHIFEVSTSAPDLYSMILSPLLPEVESLCLSTCPTTDKIEGDNKKLIQNNSSQQYLSEHLFSDFLKRN